MNSWKTFPLGSLATIRRGLSYSDQTLADDPEDGLPYFNMKSFRKGGGFNKEGLKYFRGSFSESDFATKHDVLIANTDVTPGGDIIGVPAELPKFLHGSGTLFSHHVTRLSLGGLIDSRFLSYLLCVDHYRRWMLKYSRGTTVLMLDMHAIRKIPVSFPTDKKEQLRIAEVLTSLDIAIETTEALIEKHQQIKAGLMHDLFTRGVLPNGQLRPPREQAPEAYQEMAGGWLPTAWFAKTLGAACDWYSGGTPSKENDGWWSGELPWLSPKDMKQFELADTQDHVTRQAALLGSRIMLKESVFIVVRGMILAHSFPVVLSRTEFAFNQDVKAITGRPPLGNRFLAYWLVSKTELFLRKTTEATHGTKRFDSKDLCDIVIGVPSKEEQDRIVMRLDAVEQAIRAEAAQMEKLRTQKLGLMQDLLTGKVPVIVTAADLAHA